MKTVRVKLSPEAEEVYTYLNREAGKAPPGKRVEEPQMLEAINKKVELIKANFHYGRPIAKPKIPAEYKRKYGITNLFWVGLPRFWRMFYSLTEGEQQIEIIAFVVDILDHKEYIKKFGYKRK
ncbi:MAG: hypothetical protein KAW41_03540 [Candidatus Diapherotrites archaeon]|nr:hypothetical protein [Candidatus Diapherotrites archaeon]